MGGVRFLCKEKIMQRLRFAFAAFLCLMAFGVRMQGQDFRAHISGVITDSSSAGIPGASVTLSNLKTGIRATASTNESGAYRFDYVDPGTYTLTVERAGFATFSQENFPVQAQGDVTVNARMQVGVVQETVTVDASPVE